MRLLSRGELWADRAARGGFRISERSVMAAAVRSHLRENQALVARLLTDPRWSFTALARPYSRVNIPRVFYQWRAQSRLLAHR